MKPIENALPVPELCDNCCSSNVAFVNNRIIYGKEYGTWPFIHFCHDCRASVGCHHSTQIPLGRMADRATRQLRKRAHEEFDKLWAEGLMTRQKAYNWLANELGIEPSNCHISWMSRDQLKDVITLSSMHFDRNYSALLRRKEKNDAKQQRRSVRESERRKQEIATIWRHKSKRRPSRKP